MNRPEWRVFDPPGPEGFGAPGDPLPVRQAARAAYLAACRCVYCGESITPGQSWGFVPGVRGAGSATARAHLVHQHCYEQDDGGFYDD